MPLTTEQFLNQYSNGIDTDIKLAYFSAMEARFGRTQLEYGASMINIPTNLWKYGESGILERVPTEQRSPETVMNNMVNGTVYAVPAMDEQGNPDYTKLETITATLHDNKYHVQIMDAARAKDAYENKPSINAPNFIDRLVDFFCRLFGARGKVCALWDDAAQMSQLSGSIDSIKAVIDRNEAEENELRSRAEAVIKESKKAAEKEAEKAQLTDDLLTRDYSRKEKVLSEEETAAHIKQGKEVAQKHHIQNYDESMTDWYMGLYENSHDLFPTFISDDAEIQMSKLDRDAMTFGEKLALSDGGHWCSLDLEGPHKGFDMRINTVTTLAFALTADQNLSAEAVFDFLAGKEVPGTKGLAEKLNEQIAKINESPESRNSTEIHALLQKGNDRMCALLETQPDLQNGISYQLGRTLQRNQTAYTRGYSSDITVNLKISPLAKQIMTLQDSIIDSYNSSILQGFVIDPHIDPKTETNSVGSSMTEMLARGYLPINAKGQTNAAFLEKLSAQPVQDRMDFVKENLHVLEEMNENLGAYIAQRISDENCPWLKNPTTLKEALNGKMISDYHEVVMESLQNTGKMPVFENELDMYGSFVADPNASFMNM